VPDERHALLVVVGEHRDRRRHTGHGIRGGLPEDHGDALMVRVAAGPVWSAKTHALVKVRTVVVDAVVPARAPPRAGRRVGVSIVVIVTGRGPFG
jgi:hypothetical protein